MVWGGGISIVCKSYQIASFFKATYIKDPLKVFTIFFHISKIIALLIIILCVRRDLLSLSTVQADTHPFNRKQELFSYSII